MSNKPETEDKGRPERKARERHHGVGRAGLRKSDRVPPTEVNSHEGVGSKGAANSAVAHANPPRSARSPRNRVGSPRV